MAGFLQVTFIPGLGRKGALRLQIETVLVAADHQNRGIGSALMKHVMKLGKQRGAARRWSNSPPTNTAPMRTAFMNAWGLKPATRASNGLSRTDREF